MDHELFKAFTIFLFNALPEFSEEFYEILACNLLFWFDEMSLNMQNHSIIIKIVNFGHSEKIKQWINFVKQQFIVDNGLYLPASSIYPVSTIEILSSQIGTLNTLNVQCQVLIKANQIQENYNSVLTSRIEQSTEQIEQLTNTVNEGFANIINLLSSNTTN